MADRRKWGLRWALGLVCAAGCASDPAIDPRYRPAENVLEVVAVLQTHVKDDTYRFEPARDFTGRNVYRSSLLRLESLENLHAQSLQAGHMDGVMAFAKGRALERMRAYDLAQEEYQLAAARDDGLEVEALRSADVCAALQEATQMGLDLDDLAGEGPNSGALDTRTEIALEGFDERIALLDQIGETAQGTHYSYIVQEERERADLTRARYFGHLRRVIPGGNVRAVAEYRNLVVRHEESKNANRHILALAALYSDLALEYVDAHPPESMDFDPARFQELVDSASRLYAAVANQDGTPEKIEAARRMEAFLAFALQVDSDRFTP